MGLLEVNKEEMRKEINGFITKTVSQLDEVKKGLLKEFVTYEYIPYAERHSLEHSYESCKKVTSFIQTGSFEAIDLKFWRSLISLIGDVEVCVSELDGNLEFHENEDVSKLDSITSPLLQDSEDLIEYIRIKIGAKKHVIHTVTDSKGKVLHKVDRIED